MDIPKEIELKVFGVGSLEEVERKLQNIGAEKTAQRGLIRDRYFKYDPRIAEPGMTIRVNSGENGGGTLEWTIKDDKYSVPVPESVAKLQQLVGFLTPHRSVRIRQEHGTWIWSVKDKRKKGVSIDNRYELEVGINGPEEVIAFLEAYGYARGNYLEKYRTEYALGKIKFMIDECPDLEPYLEIEAETEKQVFDQVQALGFDKSQTIAAPSKELARRAGLSEERLSDWRFKN